MIKLILAVLFFIYMFVTAYSVNHITVEIQLLPFDPTRTLSLGIVLPLFFGLGMVAAMIVGLGEWLRTRAQIDDLRRELEASREEITSLRNVMVMERAPE